MIYAEEFISGIVGLCEMKGIYLIMDDIYHKLIFDGISHIPAYKFTTKDIESTRVILINGISKSYGMTGFRVGWTIANKEIVSTMTNIQGQTITCVSTLLQTGASGALSGSQKCINDLLKTIEDNRSIVMRKLSEIPGINPVKPQGTFYAFPDFRHYSSSSMQLCEFLLEKVLVLTVPGKDFGMEGYLRLSFAGNAKEIEEGLERVRWALDPNESQEIYIGERKVIKNWKG
jgi:aspartate aminotransferase